MSILICPVCKSDMYARDKSYVCANNHSYDIAKKGYVNLLMSQKSSKKRHGDDKAMLYARSEFLSKGYYNDILFAVLNIAKKHFVGGVYLDLGCGECFYTKHLINELAPTLTIAVDISKSALEIASGENMLKAVASVSKIPVKNHSCNLITNIFAPIKPDEALRICAKNGVLIRAVPLERHLFSLKAAVYDNPYENAHDDTALEGFDLVDSFELKTNITINNNDDIIKLFMMTPYYYKTSSKDFARLKALDSLTTQIEVNILAYKPKL